MQQPAPDENSKITGAVLKQHPAYGSLEQILNVASHVREGRILKYLFTKFVEAQQKDEHRKTVPNGAWQAPQSLIEACLKDEHAEAETIARWIKRSLGVGERRARSGSVNSDFRFEVQEQAEKGITYRRLWITRNGAPLNKWQVESMVSRQAIITATVSQFESWNWPQAESGRTIYHAVDKLMVPFLGESFSLGEGDETFGSPDHWARLIPLLEGSLYFAVRVGTHGQPQSIEDVCGYWLAQPLRSAPFAVAMQGKFNPGLVEPEELAPLSVELGPFRDVYFDTIIRASSAEPGVSRALGVSMAKRLFELADDGVFIRKVCAYAWAGAKTIETQRVTGAALCEGWGMKCVKRACTDADGKKFEVYAGTGLDLVTSGIMRRHTKHAAFSDAGLLRLVAAYRSHLKQD